MAKRQKAAARPVRAPVQEKEEMAERKPTPAGLALGAKIEKLRRKLGKSQTDLAKDTGIRQQNISSIEKGFVERPRSIHLIAEALKVDVTTLYVEEDGETAASPAQYRQESDEIPLRGTAAAGLWLDPDLSNEPIMVPRVTPSRYIDQYALNVAGPSMNKSKIFDGMTVVCTSYDAAGGIRPVSGDTVHAVLRRGQLEEWSIKKFRLLPSGVIELWPHSTDPRFQEPVRFDPKSPSDDVTLEIVGKVVAVYKSFLS